MVMLMAVQQGHVNTRHHKGDLETAPQNNAFLSPKSPAPAGDHFIPAFKPAAARKLPMTDAFSPDTQQLKGAELDLRTGSKFEKVFGNGLFENANTDTASSPKLGNSAVKMNSFFTDPTPSSKQQLLQEQALITGTPPPTHMARTPSMYSSPSPVPMPRPPESSRDATPEKAQTPSKGGLAARRNAGISTAASGRLHSNLGPAPSMSIADDMETTAVQDFNAPDEIPQVARPVMPSSQSTNTYAMWESQLKQLIHAGRREEAVRMPAVPGNLVRCYVKRVKTLFSTHCTFQMYLEGTDVFLLAARRRKKSKTSSYVVSLSLDDLKRDTEHCMAKLKANFVGTEYTLWGRQPLDSANANSSNNGSDRGSNGSRQSRNGQETASEAKKGYNREDLVINFKQTALNVKGGPRSLTVAVPNPEQDSQSQAGFGSESLSHMLELARKRELPPYLEKKVAMMCSKAPEYDEKLKTYTLDFQGRVKEASVKNFQLTSWDHNTDSAGSEVRLQFGKIQDDVFALDFTYPFTVEHAFALALATIDTKLCYTI